ncbi:MAG: metal-dependent hydrolase [Flavipsychrobacter sp.]|nr:metal-dependent hydrolase [Flavipsychrobacter sp.]
MDSVTHIVLGACIGEVIAGKELGRKAMLWGALAQSFPDIDVVAELWLDTPSNLLAHRGFTHSILSCLLFTPFFALLAKRIHKNRNVHLRTWMWLFGIELFCHIFLDSQNAYGTGLFEPFSHARISFNTMFVADPLFTAVALLASVVLLIFRSKKDRRRLLWATAGIATSALYLFVCAINKMIVTNEVNTMLKQQQVSYNKSFVTPTPLNNLLWYIVANNDSGSYIGYRSVFDDEKELPLTYFERNENLLNNVHDNESLQKLKRFSQGYYIAQQWGDTVVFSDLRFGQMVGWDNPNEKFVFHYFLKQPEGNELVIQRGRFAKWDNDALYTLWSRMLGH